MVLLHEPDDLPVTMQNSSRGISHQRKPSSLLFLIIAHTSLRSVVFSRMILLSMILSISITFSLSFLSNLHNVKTHHSGNKKDRNLLTLFKQCWEAIFMLV
jgi:hypothetical protein